MPTAQNVFPHMFFVDSRKALDWYSKYLDAEIASLHEDPNSGKVMHASFKIGPTLIMMADVMSPERPVNAPEEIGTTTFSMYVHTAKLEDVDRIFEQAVKGGAKAIMKPENMFWGDRWCYFKDPFGHVWQFAHTIETVSNEQIQERAKTAK